MVSNAGWMVMGECELLTIDLIQKCFDVNFLGAVRFIQTFLPLVRKSKGIYRYGNVCVWLVFIERSSYNK